MVQKNDVKLVKCEECGKVYHLEPGDKLSNFQCECGGELKNLIDTPKSKGSKENYLSLKSINWYLVLLTSLAIPLLCYLTAFYVTAGLLGWLISFIIMGCIICGAGYLVKPPIRGAFNGLIIGALSIILFLAAETILFPEYYGNLPIIYFIQIVILGAIIGAGSGILGGYIYKLKDDGEEDKGKK